MAGTKWKPSDPGYIHINTLEFLVAFPSSCRVCGYSGISRYARASSRAVPTGFSLLPSPLQSYRQYGNSILDERYSDYKSSRSGSRLTLWTTYAAFPRPMQFRTSSRRRELNCGFLLLPRFTFPRTPFVSGVSKLSTCTSSS